MSKYDQIAGDDYGTCVTCGVSLPTEQAARAHLNETLEASPDRKSHTYRRHNPTREQRIQSMVASAVDDSIYDAIERLMEEVASGEVTEDEITKAIKFYGDFADEWERRDAA
jgi:hypothetical protein